MPGSCFRSLVTPPVSPPSSTLWLGPSLYITFRPVILIYCLVYSPHHSLPLPPSLSPFLSFPHSCLPLSISFWHRPYPKPRLNPEVKTYTIQTPWVVSRLTSTVHPLTWTQTSSPLSRTDLSTSSVPQSIQRNTGVRLGKGRDPESKRDPFYFVDLLMRDSSRKVETTRDQD